MGDRCVTQTPNAGNANNVRNVNPSGAYNNNNANNTNGVAPDCEKSQPKVSSYMPKSEHSRKERLSSSDYETDKNTGTDVVVSDGSTTISDPSIKELCCSFEALYKSARECRLEVMWKDSVAGFIKNELINCLRLRHELLSNTYKLSEYSVFTVYDKKTRLIVSTRIRDRVVQKSICNNYLYEQITKGFIYDNCACQRNKGTDFARRRLKCHLQRYYRKHKLAGYVLKVDIHDYFGQTPHAVAKQAVRKRVNDPWVISIVDDIIDSFDQRYPDKGMGLGSQITQLVQLAVLDDLDHVVKERLRIKHYIRYMDDFILIHESKDYLQYCRAEIEKELAKIGLEVNPKKTRIQPLKVGLHFLGFSFRLTDTGKVIMRLLPKSISRERRKLKRLVSLVEKGELTKEHVDECYKAWKAHAAKGNCRGLISAMDKYYTNLFKEDKSHV